MTTHNPTRELARFAVETRFEDLSPEVIHETKRILLDSIGCSIGALSIDKGKMSLALAGKLGGNLLYGTGESGEHLTAN